MKIRNQFLKAIPLAVVFACFGGITSAQVLSEQELPTLSPPLHAALYPEVMCVGCVVPHWDHGYLVHEEFDRDPAVVTMYDRAGKKVLELAWCHLTPSKYLCARQEQQGRAGFLRLAEES